VGILNILGSGISLGKFIVQLKSKAKEKTGQVPPVLKKLSITQLTLNTLGITFGLSMLISNLIPGLIIGVVLTANGVVLMYLLYLLIVIDRMQREMVARTEV
jgi:uncharacterized protein (DUF2062 family)